MTSRFTHFLLISMVCLALPGMIQAQDFLNRADAHMEAHGKAALKRAIALSKSAQFTLAAAKDYDVTFYDLNVTILKDEPIFGGRVEMRLTSLVDGLNEVQYNFGSNGDVDSVYVNGAPAQFTHSDEVVTVALPAGLGIGEEVSITTVYDHTLTGSAMLRKTLNNFTKGTQAISLATQSEPYDARNWWPCKDDPDDKADSVNITITTDTSMIPVGNGTLISDVDNGNETHTVLWHSRYPIVTYLVSVAISDYNINEYTWEYDGKSMPVGSWYVSLTEEFAASQDDVMLEGLTVFSDLFGTYPFIKEKYGMAEYTWGGAMEHQTVSSMGAYFTDIVTHELMHQWFGDKVTCATFEHIWLNEGWATYGEALFHEFSGRKEQAAQLMLEASYFGAGKIFVDDPENSGFGRIFSGDLTYNKSSWVVHMLRGVVGDSAFFRATRNYLGSDDLSNYRSVRTAEYQQFYEDESGLDLDFFFDQWIHGEYYPTYLYDWESTPVGDSVRTTVTIEQRYVPQRQVFTMPIQLSFDFGTYDTTITVWNDSQIASYEFTFTEAPARILLDKDNWILKQVQLEPKPFVNNNFPEKVLLVNGVDWDVSAYTSQLRAAYADSIYTGERPYVFYDLFPYPDTGYPSNVQEINGSTELTLEMLEEFCTIVWIGNAYNGDEYIWYSSPMLEYVQKGGNLILITRQGRNFIDDDMLQYLGITWNGTGLSTPTRADAKKIGLLSIPFIGVSNRCATFSTDIESPFSELIFTDDSTFAEPRGIGVWSKPQPTQYGESGHFVYIGLRPYRLDRTVLKQNMSFMLDSMVCEPAVGVPGIAEPNAFTLSQSYPNPVSAAGSGNVEIEYNIPGAAGEFTTLRVYNQLGQLIAEPMATMVPPGSGSALIDVSRLNPGVYIYRLNAGGKVLSRTFTVID